MGLKTRRPPKKGTAAAAKKKEEDTKTEATSESSGSTLGLDNLRVDDVQSAADKLTDEGIIATCARVRVVGWVGWGWCRGVDRRRCDGMRWHMGMDVGGD